MVKKQLLYWTYLYRPGSLWPASLTILLTLPMGILWRELTTFGETKSTVTSVTTRRFNSSVYSCPPPDVGGVVASMGGIVCCTTAVWSDWTKILQLAIVWSTRLSSIPLLLRYYPTCVLSLSRGWRQWIILCGRASKVDDIVEWSSCRLWSKRGRFGHFG